MDSYAERKNPSVHALDCAVTHQCSNQKLAFGALAMGKALTAESISGGSVSSASTNCLALN